MPASAPVVIETPDAINVIATCTSFMVIHAKNADVIEIKALTKALMWLSISVSF